MSQPDAPGPTIAMVPEGDQRERLVCGSCGFVLYRNPRIIVGAVCTWEGRYLLCRRAIAPREGFWTFPAGYLEMDETTPQGAMREVREEACAQVSLDGLLAVFDLPHISQVHMVYRGRMLSPAHDAGEESRETGLFAWDDIPWDALAYPTVRRALYYHREMEGRNAFPPCTDLAPDKRAGTGRESG